MTSPAYFGDRARLGLVVPPNNTVCEAEWASAMPPGVSLHAARFRLNPLAKTAEELDTLRTGLLDASAMLAEAEMSALAFACTAPSAVSPRHAMETAMTAASTLPSATAAAAVVDALVALGAKSVALFSPFSAAVTAHEAAFMEQEGIRVLAQHSLGHGTYAPGRRLEIHRIAPAEVQAAVMAIDHAGADALVLSGTNLVTFPMIDALEQQAGKPVVSSNQALFWSALRKAGVHDALPLGRLFRLAA
ncbi:MAG: aspartate/glutamate racemase family protein [Burkholderiales bacterium]|nr:aspartate/glutamate racemase family protein [Burkholderiales bacterium]